MAIGSSNRRDCSDSSLLISIYLYIIACYVMSLKSSASNCCVLKNAKNSIGIGDR